MLVLQKIDDGQLKFGIFGNKCNIVYLIAYLNLLTASRVMGSHLLPRI